MEYSFKKGTELSPNPYSDQKMKSNNLSGFQDQTMAQTSDFKSHMSANSDSRSNERPETRVTHPIQYEEVVQNNTDQSARTLGHVLLANQQAR